MLSKNLTKSGEKQVTRTSIAEYGDFCHFDEQLAGQGTENSKFKVT